MDCEYNLIIGERSNGKSYAIKEYAIKNALADEDSKFMYLRRYGDDLKGISIKSYFGDMIGMLEEHTKGDFNDITYVRGNIVARHINDDGNIDNTKVIGYAKSISDAERIKSNTFPDVQTIIFEEFIATKMYLQDETLRFESIVSTVSRRRRIKVYMIGNTLSRNCIYFNYFSLVNIPKQKPGSIDVYSKPTDPPQYNEDGSHVIVKVAVERCLNQSSNTKMLFGQGQKSVTNGEWESQSQPCMTQEELNNYTLVHTMVINYRMSGFLCRLYNDEITGDLFWFVQPRNRNLEVKKDTRVISDEVSTSLLHSCSFDPLSRNEKVIFNLIVRGKVFYSDNLTGTEFKEAIQFFFNNRGWK